VTRCRGRTIDQNLNRRKNIRSDNNTPIRRTLQWIKNRPNPENFVKGGSRAELFVLGEGAQIRVVAYLLVARRGNPESCNCGLTEQKDLDNHLVLVEEETLDTEGANETATLRRREEESITAEFTPRVRLDHPNFLRTNLTQRIISAPRNALLVRVTGLPMFDSEHFLARPLKRVNDWEIHPVLKLKFCETGNDCGVNSNVAGSRSTIFHKGCFAADSAICVACILTTSSPV
jgi:hypothetical protein